MAIDTTFNQMKGVNGVNKVNNNTTTKPNSEEKKPVSKAVIGASLVGLAALASVGIYIATKGKGKVKPQTLVDEVKNPTNNTQLEELQKQANELKEKIKTNYLQKLNEECPNISYHKNTLTKKEPILKEFSTNLKNKLKELQNDPEYVELTKLKHQCKRDMDNPLNSKKLDVINEAIYSKINDGHRTPYFKKLGLSIEETLNILKDPSIKTVREYNQVIYKNIDRTKITIPQLDMMPRACAKDFIQLDRLVIGGQDARTAYIQTKQAKEYLKNAHNVKINIAHNVRQSDDVKALKELNHQIAELTKGAK